MSNSTVATRSPVPENSRFELRQKLGAGSFGTVYEAFDRDYQSVVALKVLHRNEPAADRLPVAHPPALAGWPSALRGYLTISMALN